MVLGRKMVPVLLLFVAVISYGYGWDAPNSFYQGGAAGATGSIESNGGYVQSRAGADSALWNQGQYIGGEHTPSGGFGHSLPWSGNGQAVKGAGAAGSGLSGGQTGFGGYNGQAGFGPGHTIAYGNDALFPPGYFQAGSNGAPQAGGLGGAVVSGPGGYFGYGNPQRPFAAPAGSVGGIEGPVGANGGAGATAGEGLGGSVGEVGSAPEARPAAGPGEPTKGIPSNPPSSGSAADAGTRPSGGASTGGVRPKDSQNEAEPATGANGFYDGAGFGPTGAVGKGEAPRGGPQGAFGSQGAPGVDGSTGGHFGSAGPGADNRIPPSIAIALPAVRPAVAYNGIHLPGPLSYPGKYGSPGELGSHGAPWYGSGYMYRIPVPHINPDGSYGFSYQTPHSNREETGDSAGKVDGNYGFHNDGAKHNFSFSAGPDVDLRTSVGQRGGGASDLNPADYGPQSIHSRSRLPLTPGTVFAGDGNDANNEVDDTPGRGRPQSGSVANRNGLNGPSTASSAPSGSDDSSLKVLGLPKTQNPPAVGSTGSAFNGNRNDGNQLGVVRNTATVNPLDDAGQQTASNGVDGDGTNTDATTEDSTESVNTVRGSLPSNDIGRRFGSNDGPVGPLTTSRPLEQVGTRPQNDPSYRFAYQTPTATREEAAGRDGTVRGSFSYLNEAGRNDLRYQAGAGTGFRPLGGSLAVPNGLRNGVAVGPQQNVPFRFDQPASQDGANAFGPSAGSQQGQGGLRTVANPAGIAGQGAAGQAQGGYPFGSGANGNDGSAVRGSFVYNSETGRNEFIVGSGAGRRPVGTGGYSGPNGYAVGGTGAGYGLVSGGGSGFGDASASGAFGHNGRPFGFDNQGAGGFHSSGSGGFGQPNGSGLTTHNAVTRSPHEVLPPNRWNTEQNAQTTATSPNGRFTTNFDDSEQTTSFLGFGNGNEATSG